MMILRSMVWVKMRLFWVYIFRKADFNGDGNIDLLVADDRRGDSNP